MLIAWTMHDDGALLAAFVAAGTDRRPAVKRCATEHEAREWVHKEAEALSAPVQWVRHAREP